MLKLHVVITSTRPGRAGPVVAKWALEEARRHGAFDVTLVDLAELNLPLLDEPNHPKLKKYEQDHTRRWSALVDSADAFVFVVPEYNFTAPATFVNALDFLYHEWSYKTAAFVSYGGQSGGLRSVQAAKLLVTSLKMMPIPEGVSFPFFSQHVQEGVLVPPESSAKAAQLMLDELAKWAGALKPLRPTSP